MTANRWWVRLAARWLARVDGVSGQLRLAMLGLTGVSTATLTLRSYGHGEYAWPLIGIIGAGTLVYTYLYTEGGVWNQMVRDRNDLSNNFAVPRDVIDDTLIGVAMYTAVTGEEPSKDDCERIQRAVRSQWEEFRDGIDLEEDQ